jgi:alpha-beta hydrolase superfamily lysophospholipase
MTERKPARLESVLGPLRWISTNVGRRLVRAIVYGVPGGLIVLTVVFIVQLEGRPDLEVWHRAHLDEEYTADSGVETFAGYLALEDRLFAELETDVFEKVDAGDRTIINRFNRGSLSDPARWGRDWNRSFERPSQDAAVGVLLVHGMSDSPYSLRALAERLSEKGAWVVGLRLPGHGTAPAALTDVRWEDLAAAVRLGVRHLRASVDGPIFVVGYSAGGGLAVHYALRSLDDDTLPRVDGVVLISPAIGVSKVAAFAVWQGRLGRWLRLDKLAWNDIYPEVDPFKYGSFAVNAGDVVYRLSGEIEKEITRKPVARLRDLPPIVAFQSAVDATVMTSALVENLFEHLPDNGSELVLFDINRATGIETVLAYDPAPLLESVMSGPPRAFRAGVVTNRDAGVEEVILRVRQAGATTVETVDLGLSWPREIYSVSHVALPTPYDDPLYGGDPEVESPGVQLGRLAYRGERDVLRVPPSAMLRLQWNPFYPWMEERILEFMGL